MSSSDPMDRLIAALAKHTRAMQAQTKAITALAKSNEALADTVLAPEPEEGEDDGHGVDMAGNPIRMS